MLSNTSQYAIRTVLYLENHSSVDAKIGVNQISEALNIPRHFLAKVLQQLVRQNIVSSSRGITGGFYITEEQSKHNLLAVIEIFDGPMVFTRCALGLNQCSPNNPCPVHDSFAGCRDALRDRLKNSSISFMAQEVMEKQLKLS